MPKKTTAAPPVYCLDSFERKETKHSFYAETLQAHLKKNPFVSKPHRHDFYLLLYVTKGKGQHTIDFVKYKVEPNSFFLMSPGQVHSWSLSADCEGFIFFFEPTFYKMGREEKHLHEFPFFRAVQHTTSIYLKKNKDAVLDLMAREMVVEYASPRNRSFELLRSYLDVLLLKLYHHSKNVDGETTNSTFKLRQLEQFINEHFLKLKQPRDYAELMHLSPVYLNNMCRQFLNKTLSDLISERVLLEAKRFFAFSDFTVAQVSDHLGFSEPSYFIRYFRKHTGFTPEQFRESIKSDI